MTTASAPVACPSCATPCAPSAKFCPSCGTSLVTACPSCGSENNVAARFCETCGHRLDAAAPKAEERKLVTVLFADLAGSTTLGENLDPERLRVLLTDYFAEMRSIVERWGGTVEKFIGDAVMAVFGIPTLHEDDAERAVHASLEMQSKLADMNPDLTARHGVQLSMRIGINTGEALTGRGGDQFMVTGDVVNVAARLQQTAQPGEVVVGERTHLACRGVFTFEDATTQAVKGRAQEVSMWRVRARKEVAQRRGLPGVTTRLVGRDHELEMLRGIYSAAVADRQPRLVTILGPPGIGKSRLTEEFVSSLSRDSADVYRGNCLAYGEGVTYWALREVLWSAAGILLNDSAEVAADKLAKMVRDALGGAEEEEVTRVVEALAITAGIALEDNPLGRMSADSVGEALGLAWPRFLTGLARRKAVVIEIEDLHWAEPPLLEMIEQCVARSKGSILFAATARPEFVDARPMWATRSAQVRLEPLSEAAAAEVVANIAPDVTDAMRTQILAAAEGNPFYAEEIVRHLIDRRRAGTGESIAIPDTIRAVIAARIDGLSPEEKQTLQDASVVGRTFWITTLESMHPGSDVRRAVRSLEEKGLVVTLPESALVGQTELEFKHVLIRDVAYESIPRARRARSHEQVGRWIEGLAGERRSEFVELIAHHYEVAASPEDVDLAWPNDARTQEAVRGRAFRALMEAGRAAKERSALDVATQFAQRALALAINEVEQLEALELRAAARHAAVSREAWDSYLEAIEIAQRIEDTTSEVRLAAAACTFILRYHGVLSAYDWRPPFEELTRRGLELTHGDASSTESAIFLLARASLSGLGIESGIESVPLRDLERADAIAEATASPVLRAVVLETRQWLDEDLCATYDDARKALTLAHAMEDRTEAHEMLHVASSAFVITGHADLARSVAEDMVVWAERMSPHRRIHAISAMSEALLAQGQIDRLIPATDPLFDTIEEDGGHICGAGAFAVAARAAALYESRDSSRARKVVEQLSSLIAESTIGLTSHLVEMMWAFDPDWARDHVEKNVTGTQSPGIDLHRMRVNLSVAALDGDRAAFDELTAAARAKAGPACAPFLTWFADWADAVLAAREGRSAEAVSLAVPAMDALAEWGERYRARRLLVDLLPFLDRGSAGPVAERVVGELEDMGASASAATAREYL